MLKTDIAKFSSCWEGWEDEDEDEFSRAKRSSRAWCVLVLDAGYRERRRAPVMISEDDEDVFRESRDILERQEYI